MPARKNVPEQEFLVGRRIFLRPFSEDDLRYVQKWSNDPEIRRLTGEIAPMSR